MSRNKRNLQRGQALVVAISLVAFLSALSTAYLMMSWSQTRQLAALSGQIEAGTAADAVASLAIWRLSNTWRSTLASELTGEYFCNENGAEIHATIIDESQLINLNLASAATIQTALMTVGVGVGEAKLLSEEIADYVDRDDRTINGELEVEHYRQASEVGARTMATIKNERMDLPEELFRIPRIDEAFYKRVRQSLTIYSKRSAYSSSNVLASTQSNGPESVSDVFRIVVNARTPSQSMADRDVIVTFDIGEPLIPAILMWRRSKAVENITAPTPSRACREVFLTEPSLG